MWRRAKRLLPGRRSAAVLEYGLIGILVAVVVFSSVQLLLTSSSPDIDSLGTVRGTLRPGS